MRPQLIVDFSDRTLGALLVTPAGQLLPCSQEVQHVATRVLSTEILLDPRLSEDPYFAWDEALAVVASSSPASFFQRARRLGLRRPWELPASAETPHLSSPLAVLSSPAARIDPSVRSALPVIGVALLAALLDPVFSFLARRDFVAGETEAVGIVPARTGRLARLALHKVFRRAGFRRLTLLPRELAAAMALLTEAPVECLVWDLSGDDLYLHRVAVEVAGSERRLRTLAARTVRGLGWPSWVQRIAAALEKGRQVSGPGASPLVPALDRALTGLLSGSPDAVELPTSPPLRLSHGLLDEVLDDEWRRRMKAELHPRLEAPLAELDAPGSPAILLGAACGLAPLQELLLALSGGEQPPGVAETPALERLTRGVAAALLWLRGEPGRRLRTPPHGSLRLDTLQGEACELLPAAQLPAPGERCALRQEFRVAGAGGAAGSLLLHLLWGADTGAAGNASLCALPVDIGTGSGVRDLWLTLHLRRNGSGHRLRGTVEAGLVGEAAPRARAFFSEDLADIPLVAAS